MVYGFLCLLFVVYVYLAFGLVVTFGSVVDIAAM